MGSIPNGAGSMVGLSPCYLFFCNTLNFKIERSEPGGLGACPHKKERNRALSKLTAKKAGGWYIQAHARPLVITLTRMVLFMLSFACLLELT